MALKTNVETAEVLMNHGSNQASRRYSSIGDKSTSVRCRVLVVAFLMITGFVAEAVVLEDQPAVTGAVHVMLAARGEEMELVDMATGLPADAPSLADAPASVGGLIRWVLYSDRTDTLGIRHVVYQQHFTLGTLNPSAFEDGVPLAGGKLTFRYRRDGVLQSVNGGVFRDVSSLGPIAAASVASARDLAGSVLAGIPEVAISADALVSEEARIRLRELTFLRLRSEGDGRTFSYVWTVPFHLENNGGAIAAAIDAGTGTVYATWNPNPSADNPCIPASNTTVNAYGRPQRGACSSNPDPDVSNRWLWATTTTAHGTPFTHDAHRASTTMIPDIQVFMGLQGDGCGLGSVKRYQLLPLRTGVNPNYNDWHSPYFVPGCAGADAIWKTYQTMDTFRDYGWNSFDGNGTAAEIVVDANCFGNYDNAMFDRTGGTYDFVPAGGVAVCPRNPTGSFDFSLAAAIDVIAHEWGHGLMFSKGTDIWQYQGTGAAYHEGSAMIISHIVEHDQEPTPWPPGSTDPETADWAFAEDARRDLQGVRYLNVDDGPGLYSYHSYDTAGADPHYEGFPLPVAFMLAADGGVNPVCSRLNAIPNLNPEGCDIPSVPSVGVEKASEILFRTLTWYVDETTGWDDFGQLAKIAAHDLYSSWGPPGQCDAALSEQLSMHEAFHAIGYEPLDGFVCFCYPVDCDVAWPY